MKRIIFIIFIFSCISCKNKKTLIEIDKENINITWSDNRDNSISELVDSVSYIPLESHKDGLIGVVNKLLMTKNRIYVFDYHKQESIIVFNKNGKYLFRAGSRGEGPAEYNRISNFTVDDNYIYT